jgi:glycosyltransferase involved in cell wall biosynthesis
MPELITISIPTYRRPSYILHAIHSCLVQDYRPLEIDVSDDSPSDETETLLRSIALPEGIALRYWRNAPSLRQAGNVNKLFQSARGSKLVLLHDDDALLPGTISSLHEAFSFSPSVIASYGIQQAISESGELLAQDTANHNEFANRTPEFTGIQRDPVKCALWLQFPNNGYLIDTEIARKTGYRSEQEIGVSCDADFGIRLARAHRSSHFAFINRYTSQYRLMAAGQRASREMWWKLFDVILSIDDLTPPEAQARDEMLRKVSVEALVENALHGNRRRALQIFLSPLYPCRKLSARVAYHLGLIALPGLVALRDRFRPAHRAHA